MKLFFPIKLFKLLGFNNYCAICGRLSKTFLPFGVKTREKALCGKCGSLERHRLLYLYLMNNTDTFLKKIKLIHFAPEKCLETVFTKHNNITYVTADLERADVMHNIDITKIPFPKESFDRILCIHVLEHVNNDVKALLELKRILKPDGWVIIQVPIGRKSTFENPKINTPEDRLKYFGQKDHVRIYGEDFVTRIKKAGFKVKVVNYSKEFDRDVVDFYGLEYESKTADNIYLCKK